MKSKKEIDQTLIDELKKEKAALERENSELKLLISSKRFRLANKMGNSFNSLFPVGSRRRSVVKRAAGQISRINNAKRQRALKPLLGEIQQLSHDF